MKTLMKPFHFPSYKGRLMIIFMTILVISLVAIPSLVNAGILPVATPKAGNFLIEQQQQMINMDKTDVALATANPTLRVGFQAKLNYHNYQLTEFVKNATLAPTLISQGKTLVANLTLTPHPVITHRPLPTRKSELSHLLPLMYYDQQVDQSDGEWIEANPTTGGLSAIYFAGMLKDGTNRGVILRRDEIFNTTTLYKVSIPTGIITLTGKQGTFLILKQANGSPLYFDIVNHQFALSPVGTITPLATAISPQMKQSTPQPASNNPATAYPAVP